MSSPKCTGFFDCSDATKHLSLEQVMKMMIVADENGCPVFKTTNISSDANTKEEVFSSEAFDTTDSPLSIPAGSWNVTIETSDDFVGSINGVARSASRSYTIKARNSNTLPIISVVITSGSIIVDKLSD